MKLTPIGLINTRELNARARSMLHDFGFEINPRTRVGRLSAAERQLVEITRAIVEAKRVIVMDEPTSSLTNYEVGELFRLIRGLKSRGLAVIYISHRLEELPEVADQLTILRDGRAVYSGPWGEITTDEMIRHIEDGKATNVVTGVKVAYSFDECPLCRLQFLFRHLLAVE